MDEKRIVIKITPDEMDMLHIRAKLFGFRYSDSMVELRSCKVYFAHNKIYDVVHVLVLVNSGFSLEGFTVIDSLKEIETFKNKSMEYSMSKLNVISDGIDLFNSLPGIIENAKADAEKAFAGNASAGTRLRKALKEITETVKVIKLKSLGKEPK